MISWAGPALWFYVVTSSRRLLPDGRLYRVLHGISTSTVGASNQNVSCQYELG
jgi:hypothetical protein